MGIRRFDGVVGAWLSLVERLLWEQDVGGSNPLAPTTSIEAAGFGI